MLWERWRSPNGSEPTQWSTARPALVDVDGDGDLDVVSTSDWEGLVADDNRRAGGRLLDEIADTEAESRRQFHQNLD